MAKPNASCLDYILIAAMTFIGAALATVLVLGTAAGTGTSQADLYIVPQTAASPTSRVGGCSSNGCPIWPSSNVTVHMLQQLPKTVRELVTTYRQTSSVDLGDLIAAQQSPESLSRHDQDPQQACQSAKYLIMDDITTVSGLGNNMISTAPVALQALVQGRILVHASSFAIGARWSWCQESPYSVDCYYKPWTSCISYLQTLQMTHEDVWNLPPWNSGNTSAPMLAWTQKGPHAQHRHTGLDFGIQAFQQNGSSSTLWWYSLFMRQYASPAPDVEAEAVAFLQDSGVKPSDTFIVVNPRHGFKGTEQKVIQPEELIDPLKQMSACLGTNHVFLVTETKAIAVRMLALGKQHGFNVFTIKYNYQGVDTWNHELMQQLHAKPSEGAADLREISYISAKVLAVTRRGSGFIGTLQSAWAKASVASMYGYHRRPVPALSLRWTWALERGYVGLDEGLLSLDASKGAKQPWPCMGVP